MVEIRRLSGMYIRYNARELFRLTKPSSTPQTSDTNEALSHQELWQLGLNTLYFIERAAGVRPRVLLQSPPDEDGRVKEFILTDCASSMDALPPAVRAAIEMLASNPFLRVSDLPEHVQAWLQPDRIVVDLDAQNEVALLKTAVDLFVTKSKLLSKQLPLGPEVATEMQLQLALNAAARRMGIIVR
jgi:hypothetical protein